MITLDIKKLRKELEKSVDSKISDEHQAIIKKGIEDALKSREEEIKRLSEVSNDERVKRQLKRIAEYDKKKEAEYNRVVNSLKNNFPSYYKYYKDYEKKHGWKKTTALLEKNQLMRKWVDHYTIRKHKFRVPKDKEQPKSPKESDRFKEYDERVNKRFKAQEEALRKELNATPKKEATPEDILNMLKSAKWADKKIIERMEEEISRLQNINEMEEQFKKDQEQFKEDLDNLNKNDIVDEWVDELEKEVRERIAKEDAEKEFLENENLQYNERSAAEEFIRTVMRDLGYSEDDIEKYLSKLSEHEKAELAKELYDAYGREETKEITSGNKSKPLTYVGQDLIDEAQRLHEILDRYNLFL